MRPSLHCSGDASLAPHLSAACVFFAAPATSPVLHRGLGIACWCVCCPSINSILLPICQSVSIGAPAHGTCGGVPNRSEVCHERAACLHVRTKACSEFSSPELVPCLMRHLGPAEQRLSWRPGPRHQLLSNGRDRSTRTCARARFGNGASRVVGPALPIKRGGTVPHGLIVCIRNYLGHA